jgi:PAS domain S-box-containing protein
MEDMSITSRFWVFIRSAVGSRRQSESELAEREIIVYRILLGLAPFLIVAYGLMYWMFYPQPRDPLWARVFLTILPIALIIGTYRSHEFRQFLPQIWRIYLYLVTIWVVGITTLNGFTPEYEIGLVLVIAGISGLFSIGVHNIRPVLYYLLFACLLPIGAVLTLPNLETHNIVLIATLLSVGLIFYPSSLLRVWMQNSLRRSESRYRALIEQASDGIFIFSPTEGFEQVNQQACTLTGYSRSELLAMRPEDIITDDNLRDEPFPQRDLVAGETVRYELELRHKEGHRFPVEISVKRIEDDMIQAIVRDITQRLKREDALITAKEEAEEMNRLKSSFLANMSHEIRTPLASIRGYLELLSDEAPPELQPLIRPIDLSSNRLFETLNSVLDLAQLESGSMNLSPQFLDVAALARETVETFQQQAREKGLSLTVETDPDEIPVYLDRGVLVRSLDNLIGNAIKFTEDGGVTVRVTASKQTVWLEVEDTGIGISEKYLPKLYKAFSQESTGAAREYEGTGLGLAITNQLVNLVDGSLSVESTKGKGTTFTMEIPRLAVRLGRQITKDTDPSSPEEPSPSSIPPDQHVLVVDDDQLMRNLLLRVLPETYTVDEAPDASSAFEKTAQNEYDIILMDINLKDSVDGVDVLRKIRKTENKHDTFVLAVTAYAMPGDNERFLEQGFDGYIAKPFIKEELFKELARAGEVHNPA